MRTEKGRAGKRTVLLMKRSKNGRFNNRSRAANYWDTFRWDRLFFIIGIVIGLIILWVTLGGKV